MTNQVSTQSATPAQQAPYAVRQINLTFLLGEGSFGASGQNSMTLTGLRVICQIETAALPNTGPATIRVYGLTPDQINQLSRAGLVYQGRTNHVLVQAGDAVSGMATVFKGLIIQAYPDFNASGESAFVIFATSSNIIQLKPVQPISYPNTVPVSQILQTLSGNAGLTFENGGINSTLSSPYLAGTTWSQINSVIRAANCFSYIDLSTSTLAAWPKTGSRSGSPTVISARNGSILYPTFEYTKITVRTLFNPSIIPIGPGKQIQVISNLTPTIPLAAANGLWTIVKIDYNLASQMPGGPWEMVISASPADLGGQ